MPNPIASDTQVNYTYTDVPGLVGAWTFDEGAGETAFDTANYGSHGALVYIDKAGPAWTAGRFGGGLLFDGVDDQVTMIGSGSLENVTDGDYSFSAWAAPDSLPPNTSPNNPSYSILVRAYTGLYYDHDQRFRAVIRLSDGTQPAVSSDVFEPGIWHHLTMVVDDANKSLHLYVDGQEVDASPVSYTGTLADHEDAPYYIGTSEPLTERYELRFSGKIDEARIFDRALSGAEVQELFAWFPSDPSCLPTYLPVILK
jgi:hypothetical protein